MKKIIGTIIALAILFISVNYESLAATLRIDRVPGGGTGVSEFAANTVIVSGVTATSSLSASTTPQFAAIIATSTTATSTFAGGLVVGTNGLVYDFSTRNVGIGTTSPDARLHIVGTAGSGVVADAGGDDFIIETNSNTGMSILGVNPSDLRIIFGTPDDAVGAELLYDAQNDDFFIGSATAGGQLILSPGFPLRNLTCLRTFSVVLLEDSCSARAFLIAVSILLSISLSSCSFFSFIFLISSSINVRAKALTSSSVWNVASEGLLRDNMMDFSFDGGIDK